MAKQIVKPRGKNYSHLEDRQICASWVAITEDAVKGTDQQASAFWENVFLNAKMSMPSLSARSSEAVRQRFGKISQSITKYAGCVKSINRLNKSGASLADKLQMSLDLYKADHKEEFKFLECFELLKSCPKYSINDSTKSGSKGQPASACQTASVSPVTPTGRPIGQKAAKAKLRTDELESSKISALQQLAAATRERNEIMRHSNRIKIVTTSTHDLDEISAKILKLEKQKILNEVLAGAGLCNSVPDEADFPDTPDDPNDGEHSSMGFVTQDLGGPSSQNNGMFVECVDPNSLIISDYESD